MLQGHPCKVIDLAVSKPGKHGTAKVCMTGLDIFTKKKVETIYGTADTVEVPVVNKCELEVGDISEDNFVTLIKADHSLKEDIKLPTEKEEAKKLKDVFEQNRDGCTVYFTIIRAIGKEKIVGVRSEKVY
jgi:translation initiation factor 5A